MSLRFERLSSPLGALLVVWDVRARLVALDFPAHEERLHRLLRLRHGDAANLLATSTIPSSVRAALDAFFCGDPAAVDHLDVNTGGTAFEQRVWTALRAIPAGTTTSYGDLAERVGNRGASRAVGRANGANPIAIVIPCHRVIGKDGSLTGYAGGIETKRWLLDHERRARSALSIAAYSPPPMQAWSESASSFAEPKRSLAR